MTHEAGEPEVVSEPISERGIFDCDDAYRTPSRADYERLFSSGIIVLDTNVLINLYRSNERTRKDTFAVLSRVREQIWIPHQVLAEFWRNRDLPSVRGHHKSKARDVSSALDKTARSTRDALDRWLKDVHLVNDDQANRHIENAKDAVAKTLAEVKQFIEQQAERDALEGTASTQTDPVLRELEPLLYGRIGAPLTEREYDAALSEAARRGDEEIPPGYEDFKSKPPAQAAGDYLVWAQLLKEAERRKREVLLVTGDVKEDWWVSGGGQGPARPRTELRVELRQRAGVELFMLTPSQLLVEADRTFSLKVDERSVSDLATSENPGTGDRPPKGFAKTVYRSLQRAHERAAASAILAGTKRSYYGTVMTATALEELSEAVFERGGSSVPLNSTAYPLLNNCLLIPFRYSQHPASLDHALGYLNDKRTFRKIFNDLSERPVENFSLSDFAQPSLEFPDLATSPVSGKTEIVMIPFASDAAHGIHQIYWATLRMDAKGEINWGYVEELYSSP